MKIEHIKIYRLRVPMSTPYRLSFGPVHAFDTVMVAYIVRMPLDESEALLDELWTHAARPEHAFAHRWRVGDVLMWDNRTTLYRRDPFDSAARRLMYRTRIKGKAKPQRAF